MVWGTDHGPGAECSSAVHLDNPHKSKPEQILNIFFVKFIMQVVLATSSFFKNSVLI